MNKEEIEVIRSKMLDHMVVADTAIVLLTAREVGDLLDHIEHQEITIDKCLAPTNISLSTPPSFMWVGKNVLIQTASPYFTGEILSINYAWVVLKDAAWIPSLGRHSDSILNSTIEECEPVGDMAIPMSAIIHVVPWRGKLPKEQK